MKKRRIVIASVLKPVDDTRMFEKMGMTLSDSGAYEVVIIGYPSNSIPAYPNTQFFSLRPFSRISWARLLAPIRIRKIIHQAKPDILIVNTHELLIVAILNRIFFGVKIVYDVRENYYRNILFTEAFPLLVRPLVAAWVRIKERLAAPFFHRIFLAEKGYEKEMSFFGIRSIIIENKAKVSVGSTGLTPSPSPEERGTENSNSLKGTLNCGDVRGFERRIRLLFSGTLAESTGVFHAISLAKELHEVDPSISLTIIGFCAIPETLQKLRGKLEGLDFIHLIGGDRLVPHPEIIHAIQDSDFGLVCYPLSRNTENSIPTKLYEYLASRLPIIVQNHQPWVDLCTPYQACIPIDFHRVDSRELLAKMRVSFYTQEPKDVTWESEGEKVLEVVGQLLNPAP